MVLILPANLLIGTSGWGYSDWHSRYEKTKIPLYPHNLGSHQRLAYYSEIFSTVEINTTFYHYPRANVVQRWEAHVPPNFIFSYKIPRLITHQKKLANDYFNDLHRFLDLIRDGLRAKAGPALLQLPPKFSDKYFRELEIFLRHWPHEIKLAVEFRDVSWVQHKRLNQVLELLEQHYAAFCIVDEPLLPPITPITADFAYIRFHGHGLKPWYFYKYTLKELKPWASRIQKMMENTRLKEIFTYFNNHPAGHAPANAQQLAILLRKPLKKAESINMAEVRKRAGELPQHSLEAFLDVPSADLDDFVRYCESCGEMVLRDDKFCESCGERLEGD